MRSGSFCSEIRSMRIHFIAIGGSAMHNLALALKDEGHDITGSDDQILEPSRGRLAAAGILPDSEGWNPQRIVSDIDIVVLGMNARADNPELRRALDLRIQVQSYPEFIFNFNKKTTRVVVGGSHGKTTITSMILHVMNSLKKPMNFLVGAQLEGFDRMVELKEDNEWCIIEGDEYLSSPIDPRPKFFWYQAHFTLISGIAWDHINVFPTEEAYVQQFQEYLETLEQNATVVWCENDQKLAKVIAGCQRADLKFVPYATPAFSSNEAGALTLHWEDGRVLSTQMVGAHNAQNLAGARALSSCIGIQSQDFDRAISSFSGAARRLELLHESSAFNVFRDFAHAPSKLKATVSGVKASYPRRELIAVFELHTYSSLNMDFLPTYREAMNEADRAFIYFDPQVLIQKRMPSLEPTFVSACFGSHPDLTVFTSKTELENALHQLSKENQTVLLMSSGWFSGLEVNWSSSMKIQD